MRSILRPITIGLFLPLLGCFGAEGHEEPEVRTLAATPYGGCAELSDGPLRCWGRHPWEVGIDLGTEPVIIDLPPHAEFALSNAGLSTLHCTVDGAGAVDCGGEIVHTQHYGMILGDYPTPVTGAPALGRIAISETGACALAVGGAAWCWGSWDGGLRGTGSPVPDIVPAPSMVATAVAGGHLFEELARGRDAACGRTASGAVWCWGGFPMIGGAVAGLDSAKACGVAYSARCANTPRQVTLPSAAVEISAGLYHVCAVLDTGAVACWGSGFEGALGQGDEVDHADPVTVPGVSGAIHVAAGMSLNCASTNAGSLTCWGIGLGSTPQAPALWANDHHFARLSGGFEHQCGRTGEGQVECWGKNLYGALGVGDTLPRASPTRVSF